MKSQEATKYDISSICFSTAAVKLAVWNSFMQNGFFSCCI